VRFELAAQQHTKERQNRRQRFPIETIAVWRSLDVVALNGLNCGESSTRMIISPDVAHAAPSK
jgi:hypothetical protein